MGSLGLTGTFPESICELTQLEHLYGWHILLAHAADKSLTRAPPNRSFMDCELSGSIPSCIGNLTNLRFLMLALNSFTGSLPTSLSNLNRLQNMYVFSAAASTLPVNRVDQGELLGLIRSLFENRFVSEIPIDFTLWDALEYLLLQGNLFHGSIPSTLGYATKLKELSINFNRLSGTVW